ncbi:leucine-rich repeat-containing protein 71-like [Pieris napi]|uniref:leucine-rich repeat-containing protein 71-like n=1 Tax=Pieris napi TaxID=78633 RepID=UPI001FBB5A2C|nr:leucine-rich repeat-containing protein 71-like [Pieris napi]
MNKKNEIKQLTDPKRVSIKSSASAPKPLDFDAFIPWICEEFSVPYEIYVTRNLRDDYISTSVANCRHSKSHTHHTDSNKVDGKDFKSTSQKSRLNFNKFIPINASYDTKGRLVEITIIGSPFEIPRKLIIAISLCVPFHPSLSKITIRKRGLRLPALYEVGKLLVHSNITEVFIEDCYVPEGSYDLLLKRACNLKHLSLRRLCINDVICVRIAKRLDVGEPASKTLLTLDLAFNTITDVGAKAFGETLRSNRCLVHLNLCSNKITDMGADSILNSLIIFPLTIEEVRCAKMRRFEYFIKKIAAFRKNEQLLISRREEEKISGSESKERRKIKKQSINKSGQTITQLAEKLTQEEIGDFVDVFDSSNINYINKGLHCNGNLRLSSLNLAYNNLSYVTVRKVYDTLLMQRNTLAKLGGLVRVVLDGNNVPNDCQEIEGINNLLSKIISDYSDSKRVYLQGQSVSNTTELKSGKNAKSKKRNPLQVQSLTLIN